MKIFVGHRPLSLMSGFFLLLLDIDAVRSLMRVELRDASGLDSTRPGL